jgi:uncharacterized membrane protein
MFVAMQGLHRATRKAAMHRPLHPLHAFLLTSTFPLFLGALLTDITYFNTYEIQWKNFASWLLVGALVFTGLTLICAIAGLIRVGWRLQRETIYLLLLLAAWVLGFVNALVHAADAWASMPTALVLSVIVMLLMLAALWLGLFSRPAARQGEGL